MNVIALVPAHNEEEQISATLDSLLAQTIPLDKILVILDNCTDSTEQIVAGCSTRFPVVGRWRHHGRYRKHGRGKRGNSAGHQRKQRRGLGPGRPLI